MAAEKGQARRRHFSLPAAKLSVNRTSSTRFLNFSPRGLRERTRNYRNKIFHRTRYWAPHNPKPRLNRGFGAHDVTFEKKRVPFATEQCNRHARCSSSRSSFWACREPQATQQPTAAVPRTGLSPVSRSILRQGNFRARVSSG